jgi:hypothetical protein
VLGRFRPAERPIIDDAITLAAQAVMVWAARDRECMNRYNPDPEGGTQRTQESVPRGVGQPTRERARPAMTPTPTATTTPALPATPAKPTNVYE